VDIDIDEDEDDGDDDKQKADAEEERRVGPTGVVIESTLLSFDSTAGSSTFSWSY